MSPADGVPSHRQIHRHRAPRSGRQWFTVVAAFIVVMTLTATATAGTLIWYSDHAIGRVEVTALQDGTITARDVDGDGELSPDEQQVEIDEIDDVMNVLVVGSDSREGLSDEELGALGTEDHGARLTDTIMLFQLDPRRDNAAVLSFPRDLRVTYCNGSVGKINGAFAVGEDSGVGGPNCLVETIHELTGVPIHHYAAVDFAGFIDVVDTLGGVEMYLDEPLRDRFAGLDLPAGCVSLDGKQALGFVRARHIDSDLGRMARQQRFLKELVAQATSAGTLMNPARLFGLVRSLAGTVETDAGLGLDEMRRIAYSLRGVNADRLVARTVPVYDDTIGGVYYAVPIESQAEAIFAAFRNGTIIPPQPEGATEAPTAAEPTAAPTEPALTALDVDPLVVLNGAGTGGLGSATSQLLRQHGFRVALTDNADAFGAERTTVQHPPALAAQAEVVAAALGDAELEPAAADSRLTVVVGADFDPHDPTLPQPPETPPTPPPTAELEDEPSGGLPPEPSNDFAGARRSDVAC